ncbi:hypothetical protein [Hyphomonas pacifica]|uniref:Uncharacterized protein n=1 Tax=Hyphomonas pacifica TaxID=1280941 RepID=A0A062U3W4_9PROT|nr:hypothetical protein [Hyphomonas pacifica]KCZ50835.1 hypothetical protein HY2_13390 [Hyphomonas pacifica]RAN33347.1 hypothetical protein HY3_13455 [Hyphomonas pacifica]RAN37006.1 hypothetical protein HY11_10385 [Hyphomonas pacifica]
MMKPLLTGLCLGLISQSALADEVWSTLVGDVVYESDTSEGWAVWSYEGDNGPVKIYLKGLAGVHEGRGAYAGVWIAPADPKIEMCDIAITNPDTAESDYNWGRVDIVFTEPDFPSGWVALRGDCFNNPTDYLVGKPVLASE